MFIHMEVKIEDFLGNGWKRSYNDDGEHRFIYVAFGIAINTSQSNFRQNNQLGRNLTVMSAKIYFTTTFVKNHHAFIFVKHLYLTYGYACTVTVLMNCICNVL